MGVFLVSRFRHIESFYCTTIVYKTIQFITITVVIEDGNQLVIMNEVTTDENGEFSHIFKVLEGIKIFVWDNFHSMKNLLPYAEINQI